MAEAAKGSSTRGRGLRWLTRTALVLVALGPVWLFLANLGALFPGEGASVASAAGWRSRELTAEFAGGFWRRPDFWRSLNLSLVSGTLTALLAAMIGIPAAWTLSRRSFPGKALLETLLLSVLVLPASSVGLALILLFQYGPLRWLQDALGFQVMYSLFPGIVLAQGVLALVFGLAAWKAAFDGVDPRLERVARSLGASEWQAVRRVTLPLALPGLLSGFVLAWVRGMAEFGAVLLFCGTFRELPTERFHPLARALGVHRADLFSISMWTEIEYGNLEYGFAIAFALATTSALGVFAVHLLGRRATVGRTTQPG